MAKRNPNQLTKTQRIVLNALAGRSVQEAAAVLFRSESCVTNHIKAMRRKGVRFKRVWMVENPPVDLG